MFRLSIFRSLKSASFLENRLLRNASAPRQIQATLFTKKLDERESSNENQTLYSEQQFLVKLKTNPDTFGPQQQKEILVKEDIKEETHFTQQPLASRRLSTKKYADIIKKLIQKGKIKESIDILEVKMLKEDRAKPENYIYNLILGACGRVGYTKKAFMLYNDMKKRGLTVHAGTYTALFNACANSPWPLTDGLSRAKKLRDIMIEKGYEPNDTNYNAMIKAFGRCGDQNMAFSLVDEMCAKRIAVKADTINFLFQTCISDKEAGFRHALLVWRKLINKHIKPNIYSFNLLLRCARDCNLGDIEVTQNVIDNICKQQKLIDAPNIKQLEFKKENFETQEQPTTQQRVPEEIGLPTSMKNPVVESNRENNCLSLESSQTVVNIDSEVKILDSRPNLLSKIPNLGNIISLTEIKEPEHRLILIGGCKGFLEEIKLHKCSPDIKTFTQLLDCIPSTLAAEKELLSMMKKENVKPDIDFYNMLIKKRSMRFDYENAKEVLKLIKKSRLEPDLITYGVLALACTNKEECIELVEQMKESYYTLNVEILGAMLSQACHHVNIEYVLHVMELCITENVQPSKKFMEKLKEFKSFIRKISKDKPPTSAFIKDKAIFNVRYKKWITEVGIDESEDQHPWQQFRETNNNDRYKPKDTARFKPRRKSLFKVKTSTKQRY